MPVATDATPNTKKVRAIELLAHGYSKTEVADSLGVTRKTIFNWLQAPEFATAVEDRKSKLERLIQDPTPYLRGFILWKSGLPDMMNALLTTAKDPSNPKQVQAAKTILEHVRPDTFDLGPSEDELAIAAAFSVEDKDHGS